MHTEFKKLNITGAKILIRSKDKIFSLETTSSDNIDLHQIQYISEILFADDCVLIADSQGNLQIMINVFGKVSELFNQYLSVPKTEVMVVYPHSYAEEKPPLIISYKNEQLKTVNKFKYLGIMDSNEGNMNADISKRTTMMRYTFNLYKNNTLRRFELPLFIRFSIFQATIQSVALQGAESCFATQVSLNQLEQQQFRLLKQLFRKKIFYQII